MKVKYENGLMRKNDKIITEIQPLRISAFANWDTKFDKACPRQETLCCELGRKITFSREEVMQVCICLWTDMGHN